MNRRSGSGADGARLPAWRLAAFASLGVPLAGAGLPLAVYLPAFYAQSLGLATVGGVFLLTRLWDTVSDPLVGILSDRTVSPFGRRRPWILAGALIFALSTFALFMPPVTPTAPYLAGWLFAFYLGWTMMQIPFLAWSGALSDQYHERSRVQAFVQTASAVGYVAVLILPALLDQGSRASPALNVKAMGLFTVATLVPTLALALFGASEPLAPTRPLAAPALGVRRAMAILAADQRLVRVLLSDFAVTLAQTIRTSLFVFFVVGYLHQPRWGAALFLLQFVFGVFAAPIWLRLAYRFGKRRAAIAGELTQVAINLGLLLAAPGALAWVIALTVAQGLAQGSGNLMLRAMVADLADGHARGSGRERSGLLFSMFGMSAKLAAAVGVGVALPLVALIGFHPHQQNSAQALLGLKLVFALGPAAAHALSAALVWRFPGEERVRSAGGPVTAPVLTVPAE